VPTVYVKNAMKINEVIQEGATMNAYYRDEKKGYWSFSDGYRDDESVKGPYFSNASMREILSTLGMNPDFEEDSPMPIDQFINLTTQWLKKNVGKQSEPEEPEVTKEPGSATMISGGRPEGYFNQAIMALNQTARKIREKYPELTHVSFN
jgi:hypothetical protein